MQYPVDLQDKINAFLGDQGQAFSVKSSQSLKGRRGRCFVACAEYAMEDESYRYVEGRAKSPDGETHAHAWLLDDEDQLIDPTWGQDDGSEYFGVIIDSEELHAIFEEEDEDDKDSCFGEGVLLFFV